MLEEMMPRWVPTENVNGFEICPGLYRDEGATAFQSAVNFTVHSKGAVTCELLLFHRKEPEPYAVIPFPENCRICIISIKYRIPIVTISKIRTGY